MNFGLILAFFALSIGTLFFLYAMKYYITLALVLGFSRRASKNNNNKRNNYNNNFSIRSGLATENNLNNNNNQKRRGIFYRLFGKGLNNNRFNNFHNNNQGLGMIPDYEKLKLKKQPFVSIHLPFYNEKKVANRILTACTSLDYENYEIVVVDDSTDETVQILEKWKKHPKVKVIHRPTREGFKGGALKVALEHSDPKTEFVVVFDADFIPYPDTIWQFLKYFNIGVNGNNNNNQNNLENGNYKKSNIAAVQGYQWHVLNKNENWITRGVRTEFAGSYVVERPGTEVIGSMKLIAGSVYMIRADLLRKYGWGTSITEDFELTLKLYADGYKVLFTPYIQTPSECVSTIKRLIRQRMRWAEGHTHQVKKFFWKILRSPYLRKREKLEFLYLSPYYLQATFFLVGTLCWFLSDAILRTPLPFWTALWGWCLVLTNMFALPLMNGVGLFLEESPQKDYLGIFSFVLLSYILVPFQAYAALKGLFEKEEGHWFRTPKSGLITDVFLRSRFRRFFEALFPGRRGVAHSQIPELAYQTANNRFDNFGIKKRNLLWLPKTILTILLTIAVNLVVFARNVPSVLATNPSGTFSIDSAASANINTSWQLKDNSWGALSETTKNTPGKNAGSFQYQPGINNTTAGTPGAPNGKGWIFDTPFGSDGSIAAGTWTFTLCTTDSDTDAKGSGYPRFIVSKVELTGTPPNQTIASYTTFYDSGTYFSSPRVELWSGSTNANRTATTASIGPFSFDATQKYLYIEFWDVIDDANDDTTDNEVFKAGDSACPTDPKVVTPAVTIPEKVIILLAIIPLLPFLVRKLQAQRARGPGP